MKRFFDPATPDEWRAQFLGDARISYVCVGPEDNSFHTSTNSLLAVYQAEGYTVYQVINRM
jgi:hypothetical protein